MSNRFIFEISIFLNFSYWLFLHFFPNNSRFSLFLWNFIVLDISSLYISFPTTTTTKSAAAATTTKKTTDCWKKESLQLCKKKFRWISSGVTSCDKNVQSNNIIHYIIASNSMIFFSHFSVTQLDSIDFWHSKIVLCLALFTFVLWHGRIGARSIPIEMENAKSNFSCDPIFVCWLSLLYATVWFVILSTLVRKSFPTIPNTWSKKKTHTKFIISSVPFN